MMQNGEKEGLLQSLREGIISFAETAEVRGTGAARFLFVTRNGRSVELSFDQFNHVWVEYWERTLDEDASPIRDETFCSIAEAQISLIDWLK